MKAKRHAMITRLIASQNVETQEELARTLCEHGFSVTQATVSRDIKALRLIKVLTPEGRYRYATVEKAEADMQERFIQMFSNCVLSVSAAGNLLVIKTIAGSANAAAEALHGDKANREQYVQPAAVELPGGGTLISDSSEAEAKREGDKR